MIVDIRDFHVKYLTKLYGIGQEKFFRQMWFNRWGFLRPLRGDMPCNRGG